MAFVRILVHAVWGTKNSYPFLNNGIFQSIIAHIKSNAIQKEIYIDCINGTSDHMHCLLWLNAEMSISKVIGLIKGESSNWINKQNLIKNKFEWADEYYAASISESMIDIVRKYIDDQEEHHKKLSFHEECEKFLKEYKKSHG